MLPATFAGDDKGNPYTHKLIKTLAFSGCWREYVILRNEHQSIKWSNVDKLPLLFQIVLGDDSSYDSSYNRPFHGFFSTFLHGQVKDDPSRPPLEKAPFNFKTAKFEYKVICWKLAKTDSPLKVAKIYRRLYGGGNKLAPLHTNVCKFSQLSGATVYISLV